MTAAGGQTGSLRGPALWTLAGGLVGSSLTGLAWVTTTRLSDPPPEPPASVWVEPASALAPTPQPVPPVVVDTAEDAPPTETADAAEPAEAEPKPAPVRTGIAISTRRLGPDVPAEPAPIVVPTHEPDASPGDDHSDDPAPSEHPAVVRIRVNVASAAELELLPGIGPTLAARIIEERETRGPFRSVDDLQRVRGIGAKTATKLAPHVRFD